jgi:long-chain fatty acid transport protein
MFVASITLPAGMAEAGAFGNRLQSSIGAGVAFAGAGTMSYGLSGIFWNPAAVNLADGFMYESSWTLVVPQSDIEALRVGPLLRGLPTDSGNIGISALVPGSYGAYRIDPDWAIGFSINAPFGLATKPNLPWAGQNYAITSKASVIDAALVLGYKVNDWLNIGVGPRLVYGKAKFSRDLTPLLPGIQYGILDDLDDVGFGFEAGLTLKPWAGGEVALGYRSRVDLDLDGKLSIAAPLRGAGVYGVTGEVTLPDQLTLGLSQDFGPQWRLLASIEWRNWSLVQDLPFRNAAGVPLATLTFRYEDGWNFALGAEYAWNESLTLRGGVSYEISPVQDEFRDVSIPDADRFWVSAGLSYAITDRWFVDFGYSHAFVDDAPIRYNASHPDTLPLSGLIAKSESSIDVVSIGFRYKFGGAAVAAVPQSGLITK